MVIQTPTRYERLGLTTIQLHKDTVERLRMHKSSAGESHEAVIQRALGALDREAAGINPERQRMVEASGR